MKQMKNETKTVIGILITILIFLISIAITKNIKIPSEFVPSLFVTNSVEIILAGILIYYFQSKKLITFKFKLVKLKVFFTAVLTTIIAFVIVNITSIILFKIFNISLKDGVNPFLDFSPSQFIVFILIYASIAEEILFRGFLLNMLQSLKNREVQLFKIKISLPVIISGLLFGLVHFILLSSGASIAFVLKTVFLTATIGVIAGYFQEKNDNNILIAIVVHMTVNAIGLIGLFITLALNK